MAKDVKDPVSKPIKVSVSASVSFEHLYLVAAALSNSVRIAAVKGLSIPPDHLFTALQYIYYPQDLRLSLYSNMRS